MSVNKDKTLAKVRTFAKDFAAHQPPTAGASVAVVKKQPEQKIVAPAPEPKITVVEKKLDTPLEPVEHSTIPVQNVGPHIVAEVPKSPPKTPVHSHIAIPSFHELEQSANKKPEVTVKRKDRPRMAAGDVDATVITANKKSRQKTHTASIFDGVTRWFKDLLAGRKRRKTPTYKVQDTIRRKGVIQKATTKSGSIFTADNETLREEILRRRKQADHELDITWSANTESAYRLLASPEVERVSVIQPQQVEITPKVQTVIVAQEPEPTPEPAPVFEEPLEEDNRWNTPPEPEPVVVIEEVKPVEISASPVTPNQPEPIVAQEPEPTPEPAPVFKEPLQNPEPIQPEPPRANPLDSLLSLFRGQTNSVNTNALALAAVAIIASIFIVVVSVRAVYGLFTPDIPVAERPVIRPVLVSGPVLALGVSTSSKETIVTAIAQADALAVNALQEIQLVTVGEQPINPEDIITLLEWNMSQNLIGTVEDLRFIVIDNVQHGIILKISDDITALGGMLRWEESMAEDVSDVLYTIQRPEASLRFTDESYGIHDMRVLTDGIDDVLVYGFVAEDIIVITKTVDSFKRLAQ